MLHERVLTPSSSFQGINDHPLTELFKVGTSRFLWIRISVGNTVFGKVKFGNWCLEGARS